MVDLSHAPPSERHDLRGYGLSRFLICDGNVHSASGEAQARGRRLLGQNRFAYPQAFSEPCGARLVYRQWPPSRPPANGHQRCLVGSSWVSGNRAVLERLFFSGCSNRETPSSHFKIRRFVAPFGTSRYFPKNNRRRSHSLARFFRLGNSRLAWMGLPLDRFSLSAL